MDSATAWLVVRVVRRTAARAIREASAEEIADRHSDSSVSTRTGCGVSVMFPASLVNPYCPAASVVLTWVAATGAGLMGFVYLFVFSLGMRAHASTSRCALFSGSSRPTNRT